MESKAFRSLNEAALQVQLDEAFPRKISTAVVDDRPTDKELADKSGYLRPTAKQLRTAIQKRKENMEDPVLIVKGRDNWGGHVQQKKITGQDMENAAGEKRKAKIARRKIQKDHVEYDEVYSMVLEYFEAYFGGQLNESTTGEDIMNAVYDLVDLTEAVCESVGLDEEEKSHTGIFDNSGEQDPLKIIGNLFKRKKKKKKPYFEFEKGPEDRPMPDVRLRRRPSPSDFADGGSVYTDAELARQRRIRPHLS